MKKLNYLLAMLALCVLYGCSEDEPTSLAVVQDTLTFPYQGGTQSLSITSDGQWGISQLPEWVSASIVSGNGNSVVSFTATENSAYDDREGQVVVYATDGNYKQMLTIRQRGTHTSEISVNSKEEIVFGGRTTTHYDAFTLEYCANYVTVTCDTEWKIDKPSWMTVGFSGKIIENGEGTVFEGPGNLYMMVNEVNSGEDARRSTVTLKTLSGESKVEIPVCQLGKDELSVYRFQRTPTGISLSYKVGANVEYIQAYIGYGNQLSSPITYQDMYQGGIISAKQGGDYIPLQLLNFNFHPDTDYTLISIGGDADSNYAPLSKVCRYVFHSLTEMELRPRVEIKDVKYENGTWSWTMKPNEYTKLYTVGMFDKSILNGISPEFLPNYLWWQYFNTPVPWGVYDREETITFEEDATEDMVIVAFPWGMNRTPSVVEIYVTDFFSHTN